MTFVGGKSGDGAANDRRGALCATAGHALTGRLRQRRELSRLYDVVFARHAARAVDDADPGRRHCGGEQQ